MRWQFCLLLAQTTADVRSVWDIALQFGMAGAVLVVVGFFLHYLKGRDSQDERRDLAIAASQKDLATEIHQLAVSVHQLNAGGSRRIAQTPFKSGDGHDA